VALKERAFAPRNQAPARRTCSRGVDPSVVLLRVRARAREDEVRAPPASRVSAEEMQSGLPVGVAAFIARERERAKVADLVADAIQD
jgi:hypothetical protein